jgi:hypothetical protein
MSRLFKWVCLLSRVLSNYNGLYKLFYQCVTIFSWDVMRPESTWQVSHYLAYRTRPGWQVWSIWWNENWQGKPKYLEKACPSATLSTTNPTSPDLGPNPGSRGGKPANRLSNGTSPYNSKPLRFQKVSKFSLGFEMYITHLLGHWDRNNCWLLQVGCCSKSRCDWNLVCFDAVGTVVMQSVHSDLSPYPAVVSQHNNRDY